ncbi:carboxypeptidase regulatory-like domain-containing protein [Streptomyces cocklensis]|uniref:Galactose oxidase n=1 Tax=Actinacidiphila cocklensis TaxID=887465 RepID=A0A9W4DIC0_9ACTN|nr:carboxypeptidase regulatory-like domain-containing protein [Actinacidiphila cocklensis]MDD1058608.1 carboxypeptidase regulatory-like domain-containing protein [Actinacidiphila cocklensis]CAG6390787.1 Galactose oxidase [Actinacidiphila cocklensis]
MFQPRKRDGGTRALDLLIAVSSAAVIAVLGLQSPARAAPSTATAPAAPASASADQRLPFEPACATPAKGDAACYALRRTDVKPVEGLRSAVDTPVGYGPADLQDAYALPEGGGTGQTVAIVDAFDDPAAEADLAVYREQYGLPACTSDTGCFRKVDQRGGTDYPEPNTDWAGEISLDLDMVSAVAPNARILLVEADDNGLDSLGAAVDEAVALGAKYVSNSYGSDYTQGSGEDPAEATAYDPHYNHPGVAVVASSGDYGMGVAYPASSQYVTSVGGTSLVRAPGTARGWSEAAWNSAGSGCSAYEPKPAFQKDTGCPNRSVADVSAVADQDTGVAVYQTYGTSGWQVYGGTSVSAPIIAGVYAVAGTPVPGTYPNSYPYATSGAGLNDVTGGSNGSCDPAYLCNGTAGYDGPTGLGTPKGLAAFRSGPHGDLSGTVTDRATGRPVAGAAVTVGDSAVRTDAKGAYSLTLPVGSYDVAVDAFAYATGTAKSVAVADGATLTRNFALSPLPSQTISGKVTDGSGHGWPLYARITADGVPGGPVWTDPATGAYTMTLPRGHDYTLHVTASLPGYQGVDKTVTFGDVRRTVNLSVPTDPWQATAAGYAVHLAGPTEGFTSSTAAPTGWSVVNADGTTGGWEFDDPHARGNRTGGDGAFAIADSGHFGYGAFQDTQLISPVYDLSHASVPELAFNTMYQNYPEQTIEVDATDDGGATWKNVWSTTIGTVGPGRIEVPLTDYAGKPGVRLRFHYTASWGEFWGVDNVFVGQRDYTPTPGGLVVGTVADVNTGSGLIGATVTSQDDPAVTATTVATPDDPKLGDGYYSLFSPETGKRDLAVAKRPYTALSEKVKVAADSTVSASYKLKAGRLQVTSDPISASVGWGGRTTRKLTVRNTGGAPATLRVGERSGAPHAAAVQGAPLQRTKGDFSPLPLTAGPAAPKAAANAVPSGGVWESAPAFPQSVADNAAGAYGGKIYSADGYMDNGPSSDLYALDPSTGSWTQLAGAQDRRTAPAHGFINGRFYVAGGFGLFGDPDPKTEIYDPAANTWTTGAPAPRPYGGAGTATLDGKLYTVGGCEAYICHTTDASVYDPATDSWSAIASYPEKVAWESCAGIDGNLYCAGGVAQTDGVPGNQPIKHAYVYDPDADSWSRLPDMPIPLWGSSYTSANGLLVVSSGVSGTLVTNQGFAFDPQTGGWSVLPNAPTATYRSGSALGLYKFGGPDSDNGVANTVEHLPGYDQQDRAEVSWLSESRSRITLQPGASVTVTVTLDSDVPEIMQPGEYDAQLVFSSDTPYVVPPVAVALHVAERW